MRARAIIALVAVAALVGGVVWTSRPGGGSHAAHGTLVSAQRGEVAVTVGGIGHVDTLSGAARLAVPSSATATVSGGGGATAGGTSSSASGPSSATASQAPADAVFPEVAGHVTKLLVHVGDRVAAGQPIATIADDGTSEGNLLQARSDLATSRLELAQKRVQDPARGVPPTPAEVAAGRQAVRAARAKLRQLLGPPSPADVAAARLELAKALADQQSARAGGPGSVAAAELAVDTARQKLALVTGAPDPAEVAAAQAELAKAQSELAALAAPTPTDAARSAAQLAVDAAQRKLDALFHPPAATVTAARGDVAKAEADLASLRATAGRPGLDAARSAVTAARRKLTQLLGAPQPDVLSTARSDVRRARADLAVLRQRGAPASATDLALARLKVDVAGQRVALAEGQARRLTALANASGTVTSVLTAPGAAVDPTTPLMRVQDLGHLVVTLDLSEFDIGRTRVGAAARISVDALGGREFGGQVIDVALSGNETGGVVNFPVIIALSARGRLRPGMSVSARIVVERRRDVVRVPLDAVVDQGDHQVVTVKAPSGGLRRRRVELGLAGKQFVEVRSGVSAGDRVLVPSGGA